MANTTNFRGDEPVVNRTDGPEQMHHYGDILRCTQHAYFNKRSQDHGKQRSPPAIQQYGPPSKQTKRTSTNAVKATIQQFNNSTI